MNKHPIAVLISDCHYSLKNLELSDKAFRAAIDKADELKVDLIDCGDLTDDKAIIRAEVANKLIDTLSWAKYVKGISVFCLVGNHSLINQKGKEHALKFLEPYCNIIDYNGTLDLQGVEVGMTPYHADTEGFYAALRTFKKGSIVLGHQGTKGGQMGDYVTDPSAFDPKLTKAYRIFLGHYHAHYELENTVSIGNPFTMSFGEANDGPKGFLVLYSDGSYTRQLLDYRKHVILEYKASELLDPLFLVKAEDPLYYVKTEDLLWIKIHGTPSELAKINKSQIAEKLGRTDFKLDKLPISADSEVEAIKKGATEAETLDSLIDGMVETEEQKATLKGLWKTLV